jgi:glycosyltransferase involved in cell wall biosynthesis
VSERRRRILWVSTSMSTRGGVATFVRTIRDTALWQEWGVVHVSTHRNGSAFTKIVAFARGLLHFVFELMLHRPQLVHVHTSAHGSFVRKSMLALIANAARVPVVLHVHGSEFHRFYRESPRPVRSLMRHTLTSSAAVVALGSAWAEALREIAPDARIISVPNAIRPARAVSHDVPGPIRVLFLGEVGDRKGTFTLLDAWAKASTEAAGGDEARLVIAGDGEVERARNRVSELGIGDHVDVLGWVEPERAAALLDSVQILVLPSRSEGQPMAVLEAMARGICVVASDVGGIPELIGNGCGVVVQPDDPAQLAAAIRLVLAERATRERLGHAAQQRILRDFDVDVVSRRFDTLYNEIVGGTHEGRTRG